MLNIKDNERNLNSPKTNRRILQVERDEIFHRKDIKDGFVYALVGITVVVGLTGLGYLFVQQLRK